MNQLVGQRYEVMEKVGESPLFTVYKARDRAANRVVAIKAITPTAATDTPFLDGLKSGLQAAALLDHPNITHFQEAGQEGETPYLVTEFVRGINLKERIRRIAPFTLSVAVDFAVALGEALHYAHSLGQAHGDLRPQNIVISPEGTLKITDFGIQRAVLRSPQIQRSIAMRSAPYHAPELSTTQPGTVPGDLYAVGAILYEMLTGTPVYSGDTPEAIADQHAFANIPTPRAINPGVPLAIEGIIVKCLQKRTDTRYRTASELLNDLKAVRDALRFGKSLSWSPIEVEKYSLASERPATPEQVASRQSEPIAEVAASSQAIPMPQRTNNRLRARDERVSIYLKAAIAAVFAIIVGCVVVGFGIYSFNWVEPTRRPAPQFVGKDIEAVRKLTNELKVKLNEHGDYLDKPRNIVYRTDKDPGSQLRPGLLLNVWYSKGPNYVEVPKLIGLTQEEAEQKLKDAGLTVGKVKAINSDSVERGRVVKQDDVKRVQHDTAINFVVSDGAEIKVTDTPPPPEPDPNVPILGTDPNAPVTKPAEDPNHPEETHTYTGRLVVRPDNLGSRQVRIEYADAIGDHTVVDETYKEGDTIPLSFTYFGRKIKIRVYYNNALQQEQTYKK